MYLCASVHKFIARENAAANRRIYGRVYVSTMYDERQQRQKKTFERNEPIKPTLE